VSDPAEPASPVEPVETPFLRIVKGDPTPEEVAALVAVVSSLAAASAQQFSQERQPRPEWSARHRLVRRPLHHGPGAWRASGLG
jgi:hypothetical protein